MQINRVQSFQPRFQAQFSKDENTKQVLKRHLKDIQSIYNTMSVLDKINSKDSISLQDTDTYIKDGYNFKQRVKNESTGGQIEVVSDVEIPLFAYLERIFMNPDSQEYKKLFGNSKLSESITQDPVAYCKNSRTMLDKLSGAEEIEEKIETLYNEDQELIKQLKQNENVRSNLSKQQDKLRKDYVQALIDK